MKTKLLAILLTLAMLTPTLAACGKDAPDETEPSVPDTTAPVESQSQETETQPETEPETEPEPIDPDALPIIVNGESEFVIVRGENAADIEIKAAEELQSYLRQITGAELPIVTDSTPAAANEIVIGQTNRETDGQFDRAELSYDGFIIKTDAGKLWLIGADGHGSLYAVYELLEAYLDCRFYSANFERVPERKTVALNIPEDKQVPVLETRYLLWADVTRNPDFALKIKNRTYSWAGGMCHTLPELAETGGGMDRDPCLLLPETYDTVLKNVRAMLAAQPDARYISVSQSDDIQCQCADCAASAQKLGWSGHYLTFVNRIAEEIADEYPDVMVHTFAYQYTKEPPLTDIRPADNVMVQFCTISACFSHPMTECHVEVGIPAEEDDGTPGGYEKWLMEWSELCDYLAIWDYTTDYSDFNIHYPNWAVLRDNVRLFADSNARYVMEQGAYQSTNGEFCELRSYLLARLLWDPYMSEEQYYAYMDEFLQDYYGPGWEYIREYIDAGTEYAVNN